MSEETSSSRGGWNDSKEKEVSNGFWRRKEKNSGEDSGEEKRLELYLDEI